MAKGSLRVNGIIVDTDGEIKASTGDSIVIREDDGSAVITVDTNGKTSIGGPMDVGVNDTGHDVKFFGATAGKSWLWDESADKMIITGDTQLTGTLTVGVDDTGHDVKFFGATSGSYMLWDESTDDLILGGAAQIGIGTTAPETALHVVGTGGGVVSAIMVEDSNATSNQRRFRMYSSSQKAHFDIPNDAFNSATDVMTVDLSNGNVGIGTTAPGNLLNVVGTADNAVVTALQLENTDWASSETGQGVMINFKLSQAGTAQQDAAQIIVGKDSPWHDDAARDAHIAFKTTEDATMTERVRISHDGKVGINTATPIALLHVEGSSSGIAALHADADDLLVENSGAAGISINASGTDGCNIFFGDSGNASDGRITFLNTVSAMSFHTNSGAERMRIDNAGNVGIGSASPRGKFDVAGGDMYLDNANGLRWGADKSGIFGNGETSGGFIYFAVDDIVRTKIYESGELRHAETFRMMKNGIAATTSTNFSTVAKWMTTDGTGTSSSGTYSYADTYSYGPTTTVLGGFRWYRTTGAGQGDAVSLEINSSGNFYGSGTNDISDERLKENISSISGALTKVNNLKGRTFTWKPEANMDSGTKYGMIAQELEKHFPDLVDDHGIRGIDEDGNIVNSTPDDDGVENCKSVNMSGLIPVLVEAIKELSAKVKALESG
tara:strand:- start:629 stop:2629 length:2001 start_codon:yes stop_codon:yes gene_type:complete